jgi:hypothetical protein
MEVNDQLHAPAILPPRKELPVSVQKRAESILESILTLWRREKSLTTAGNRTTFPRLPFLGPSLF